MVNFAPFLEKFSKKSAFILQCRCIVLIYNVIQIIVRRFSFFLNFFSENSAKTGSGVVIYLHIIMTHDDKFADRFIGQPAIRGGLSGVP